MIKKEHKAEIKSWRKDLGNERRQKVNLEKQLEKIYLMQKEKDEEKSKQKQPDVSALATSPCDSTIDSPLPASGSLSSLVPVICSIYSASIEKYQPKYYMGEQINPACDKCDDTSEMFIDNSPKPEEFPLTRTGFNYRPTSAAQAFSAPRNCSHIEQCIIRQPFPPPCPPSPPWSTCPPCTTLRLSQGTWTGGAHAAIGSG